MTKKERPQERYDRENMAYIKGKYKKEFVEQFKEACKILNLTQSEVFRNAMIQTIERRKNMKFEDIKENIEDIVREEYQQNGWVVNAGMDLAVNMWTDIYEEVYKLPESLYESDEFEYELSRFISKIADEEIEKNIEKLA